MKVIRINVSSLHHAMRDKKIIEQDAVKRDIRRIMDGESRSIAEDDHEFIRGLTQCFGARSFVRAW